MIDNERELGELDPLHITKAVSDVWLREYADHQGAVILANNPMVTRCFEQSVGINIPLTDSIRKSLLEVLDTNTLRVKDVSSHMEFIADARKIPGAKVVLEDGYYTVTLPDPPQDTLNTIEGEPAYDGTFWSLPESSWMSYSTDTFSFTAWDMFGASFNSDGYFIRYAGMFDDGTTHFTDAYNIQRDGSTITIENGTGTTTQLNAYINFTNASGITINDSGVFFDTVEAASIIRNGKTFYIQNATNVSVTSISMTAERIS
jgi:hypothetical protein